MPVPSSVAVRRLAALVLSLCATPAFAAMQAKPVEWTVGQDRFSGVLVYDDAGGKRPGLVMVPDWKGVTDNAVAKATHVAGKDYVARGRHFAALAGFDPDAISAIPGLGIA